MTTTTRPPVLDDRREWRLVTVALLGGALLLGWRGRSLHARETFHATLTLITADRYDLSCASADKVGAYQCLYQAPGHPVHPTPEYRHTLVPYLTNHGQLFFIPGLWDDPALGRRLADEPPQGRDRDSLRRFDARCELTLVTSIHAATRFSRDGAFSPPSQGWIARAKNCTVSR